MQKSQTAKRSFAAIGRRMLHKLSRQLVPNAGTLVMMALLLFAYHAWAAPSAAPQVAPASQVNTGLLSYQGYLTDANSEPLSGDVDITFRLYDAPSSGTALWTEAHTNTNAVPVADGLFNVMLGSLTPISSTVWSSGASYLGVQVGNDGEMSPREVVGNVPAALTVPDGAIKTDKIADGAVTQDKAPSLLKSANGDNEIIHSGNQVFDGTDDNGFVTVEYPCFPNGVRTFIAINGHWNAQPIQVLGHDGPHRCSTQVKMSKNTTIKFRLNWIAIGN